MKILVTGAAGFIGFHLVKRLLELDNDVVGLDNVNDYYSPDLKYARLRECGISKDEIAWGKAVISKVNANYKFVRLDIVNVEELNRLFEEEDFDVVVNLAAQVGVRYSVENPQAYVQSNIVGFLNVLECSRIHHIKHLVYASSSSVYGGNTKTPFSEEDRVDNPVSVYAATKKSNELMANVYSRQYHLPTTGLRFFTVYGSWGRPDMAPMLFAKSILKGEPIKVFNNGNLSRDFTYVSDIVEGIVRVINHIPTKEVPAEVYNIGRGQPVSLMEFIHTLEDTLGKKAEMQMLPMQQGDVYITYADTTKLATNIGYNPVVSLQKGIGEFVKWYRMYLL